MSYETRRSLELPAVPALRGYHVTDDPQPVLDALRAGTPLDRGYDIAPHADLLASGLYFSEAPQLWVGRSANKWKFAEALTQDQRGQIAQAIMHDSRFTGDWYVTEYEKERAARWLARFMASGSTVYLQSLAEQPYNVHSWKPAFLAQFGLTNPDTPHAVPVQVQGLFADVSSARLSAELVISLKQGGYDGAFVHASIAFLPQAVVWHNRAVVQFGEYQPSNYVS